MKASDYIVKVLIDHEIKNIYGYQGTMISHFVDSLYKNNEIKNHVCYNEQSAAFAAVGESKLSGKLSAAYATSGPGAINLISGIADAYYDSVPVLFITGQINTYEYEDGLNIRQHSFQETNIVEMVKGITKYAIQVKNAFELPKILNDAIFFACSGRKGPVLIDLPMNVQRENIEVVSFQKVNPITLDNEMDIGDSLRTLYFLLNNSNRPVFLLGNGFDKNSSKLKNKLLQVSNKLRIPIATTLLAKDVVNSSYDLNIGVLGAAYGFRTANLLLNDKADLIISLGASMCKRQTGTKVIDFAKKAKIVRFDVDENELCRDIHNDIKINANCNKIIEDFDVACVEKKFDEWSLIIKECKQALNEFDYKNTFSTENYIVSIISSFNYNVLVSDVGQHMMWVSQSGIVEDNRYIFSGGHGAMGFALPASIGAYYATKKPVICICGDGSLQMNIQELQWIVSKNIPIQLIVFNNQSLGLIRQQQDDFFNNNHFASTNEYDYSTPKFDQIAKAYGINSLKIKADDFNRKIMEQLNYDRPNLIEVIVNSNSKAYPKTFFGQSMSNQKPNIDNELLEYLLNL